ncbi:MAG: aminotransferase class V-fold PLP-dependent enzyme [Candidatus Thorarchaeota archaeon]
MRFINIEKWDLSMTPHLDEDLVRELWPTLSSITYLNTASTGVPSVPVAEAIDRLVKNRSEANWTSEDTQQLHDAVKAKLSMLIGGSAFEYAFVPSTSAALNAFGHSIEYPAGSNIVICDLEFPSNYIPWQNIASRYNVELRIAKSRNGAAPAEEFRKLIDSNTRVVAVSHTQFGSGYRSDLRPLAKAVHSNDGFLVADIIQSVGWADINLDEAKVDFAAGQATKWIAGPIGAGYAYIRNETMQYLNPIFLGWRSVKRHRDFTYAERQPKEDASMFEWGSPPLIAYAGFSAALDVLLNIPAKTREETALDNASYLKEQLNKKDISFYDFDDEHDSPIVSCQPSNLKNLQNELKKEGIFCSVRHGRLRVSPHFYNTHHDIDRLVHHLE